MIEVNDFELAAIRRATKNADISRDDITGVYDEYDPRRNGLGEYQIYVPEMDKWIRLNV